MEDNMPYCWKVRPYPIYSQEQQPRNRAIYNFVLKKKRYLKFWLRLK